MPDHRLDRIEDSIGRMDGRVDRVESDQTAMRTALFGLDNDKGRLGGLESEFRGREKRIRALENTRATQTDLKAIEMKVGKLEAWKTSMALLITVVVGFVTFVSHILVNWLK